jgi:hypothetical protein
MVLGYPGATRRYRSSHAIDFFVNHYYPRRVEYFGEVLDILDEEMARGRDVELKLTGTKKSLANAHKNYHGMLDGLRRADLLGLKMREEEQLGRYLDANPKLTEEYGGVVEAIGEQYDGYMEYWEQMALLRSFRYVSGPLRAASEIYKWAVEREKKDIDRDSRYQDRDEPARRQSLALVGKGYDEQADRRLFAFFLGELIEAGLAGEADGIPSTASGDEVRELCDRLYGGTRVTDDDARMEMFGKSVDELLALNDPFIEFAASMHEVQEDLDDRYEAFTGALQKLRPKLIALRAKFRGGTLYPDANSTMRLSVGEVKGYAPRDAVTYSFQTVLSGVLEKHTGEEPFDVPERLRDLYAAREFGPYVDAAAGDVPVCFLTTNDVTGGNSGSPILNGRGELIGLVFDGNFESISADYQFIPKLTRTINVDSRFILFVVDKYAGARTLLEELKIAGGGARG